MAFGIRHRETRESVSNQTVFEAASLSKPVVACAALQLVDAGKLDLDEPLSSLIGPVAPGDPASASITTRHVLSHTTGLPNWRRPDLPLRTYFAPGSRFSYSGEGFVYLQSALESLTAAPLELLLERLIFEPLGMADSSFVWRKSFDHTAAAGHTIEGKTETKFKPHRSNAAFSLHTTASDYGRFVTALMGGSLLSERMASHWLAPRIPTPRGRFEALESSPPETEVEVFWGLGWGLEPNSQTFFHWGANPGMTSFVLGMPARRSAFVAFMNSDTGLHMVPGIIKCLGDDQKHPSLGWLGLPEPL